LVTCADLVIQTSLCLHEMRYEGPEECHNGLCDRPCGLHWSEMACESAERQEGQLNGMAFLIPTVLLGWQRRAVEDDAQGLKGV
jgi:hypothetical protein